MGPEAPPRKNLLPMTHFDWISSQAAFDTLASELQHVDAYALDTEFHRERTFLPVLALVQIATHDRFALILSGSIGSNWGSASPFFCLRF